MNRTKIEWCDYTWNPITGCKRGCSYCYGARIRKRFHPDIPWSELMWFDERLDQPLKVKKPSRIFVGSMSDICYWRKIDMERVLEVVKQCPQHTFIFLTKNPFTYRRVRKYPKNCWLGATVTRREDWGTAAKLVMVKRDNTKFLSIEPILGKIDTCYFMLFKWVILGGLTPKPVHKAMWIKDFLDLNKEVKIPVFMKSNLKPIWKGKLIQEYPE